MSEPCPFAWYELLTTDLDGASAFYGKVMGWQAAASPMAPPGMDYRLFAPAGAMPSAGLTALPDQARAMGVPPHWLGYVAVVDAAAMLARAVEYGGKALMPVTTIPQVCHFALMQAPDGAVLGLMQPINPPPDMKPDYMSPGRVGWHEHYAEDVEASLAFYGALFGWTKGEAMDTPMGPYQFYKCGEITLGGMMKRPPQVPVACWQYYVNVADFDASLAAITAGGGAALHEPMPVPGGQWVLNARDPQGAVFAMVGKRA